MPNLRWLLVDRGPAQSGRPGLRQSRPAQRGKASDSSGKKLASSITGNATNVIRAKAFDISEHYRQHWQGTGFKAQLVAPSKAAAVRFKEVLEEIGHVSSAIVISPPDENEGNEEVDQESKDLVRRFWSQMMARYKTEEEYNRQIIDAFKGSPNSSARSSSAIRRRSMSASSSRRSRSCSMIMLWRCRRRPSSRWSTSTIRTR